MYVFVLVMHKKVYTREKQMNYQKFFPPSFNEFSQLTIASGQQNNTKSDHRIPQNATACWKLPAHTYSTQLPSFNSEENNPGAQKNGTY